MIEESVHGAALRYLGLMENESVREIWNAPLKGANVLPDLAARFLMIEPKLKESVVGIEVYEEGAKKIPATHKATKDKDALTIGSATDTTGIKRKIKISDIDLRRHYQIVGQTGTGKSTLLVSMILSAVEQGHGLTFLIRTEAPLTQFCVRFRKSIWTKCVSCASAIPTIRFP